jgi:hypothetical protein
MGTHTSNPAFRRPVGWEVSFFAVAVYSWPVVWPNGLLGLALGRGAVIARSLLSTPPSKAVFFGQRAALQGAHTTSWLHGSCTCCVPA